MNYPADPQSELATLGCVVINPESLHEITAILGTSGECFHDARNEATYEAMIALQARGVSPDLVTLHAELGDRVSGADAPYLASLSNTTPTSAGAAGYAEVVRANHTRRQVITRCQQIAHGAQDVAEPVETSLDALNHLYSDLSERHAGGESVPIGACVGAALDRLKRIAANDGKVLGIPSGLPEIDKLTGGWESGELIIVAARPSAGKTAFALNLSYHAARDGTPVYFFSLEMDRTALAQRLLCMAGRAAMDRFTSGFLARQALEDVEGAAPNLSDLPLYIDDSPRATLWELQSKARRLQRKHGRGLIVVDYLQLLTTGKKSEARYIEVGEISRGLKALARELEAPVIALCQLSREAEKVATASPQALLPYLRESGSLEQDADKVITLARLNEKAIADLEKKYGGGFSYENVLPVAVAKNRNGTTGQTQLAFNRATQVIGPLTDAKAHAHAHEHAAACAGAADYEEDDTGELF